jgi:hypothetical protein
LAIEHSRKGKSIFLGLGEGHSFVANSLHHMLVINGLKRYKDFSFDLSIEQDEKAVIDVFLAPVKDALGDKFNQSLANDYIKKNHIALKTHNTLLNDTAPYTRLVLKHYYTTLAQSGMNVKLSDAPQKTFRVGKNQHSILDEKDPLISELIKKDIQHEKSFLPRQARRIKYKLNSIDSRSSKGTELRNQYSIAQLSQDNNAVHLAGVFHIINPRNKNNGIDGSILTVAKESNFAQIGRIFITNTPNAHEESIFSKLNIHPITSISNYSKHWLDWKKGGKTTRDFLYDKEEINYSNTKLRIFGLGHLVSSGITELIDYHIEQKEKHQQELIELHLETA